MRKKLSGRAKKQILNILFLVVLVGITLTVLLVSYRDELNFRNIAEFLSGANVWLIVAAFGCMVLFILFEGISIHLVSRRLGHRGKFTSSVAYSTADVYYSAITPSASGGQPASAYYMVRDGMSGGVAGFTLVFNLIAYTAAVIVIGITAFALRPGMFLQFDGNFARVLVILGLSVQTLLLGLCVACIFCHKAVLKVGNGLITVLAKIRIAKHPDKWRKKLSDEVEKFAASKGVFRSHPALFVETLLINILQRVSQTLIPCLICYAVDPSVSFVDLFAMQAFVLLGYNFVPLPGGVGAYEYLYVHIYRIRFLPEFILSAMMVSRLISYYFCIVVSGVYTLVYHALGIRSKSDPSAPATESGETAAENLSEPTVAETEMPQEGEGEELR